MGLTIEQALQKGVKAHKKGNLQEAEHLYRTILESHPLHPDANHNLGIIKISVNRVELALSLFKTALEANPKTEQFWISYVDALVKNDKLEDAKKVIEKAMKKGFDANKLHALLSQSKEVADTKAPSQELLNSLLEHYQSGQLGDAEKLATSITQEFPKHQFGWKVLGSVLKQTGRVRDSLVASQKSVQLAPQDSEAHSNLGNTLKELGRLEEAEGSYTKAIALKPNFAEAYSNLGNTLKDLGRLDEAEASHTQAITLKPNFAEAYSNLGATLIDQGRLDEAEASYMQAIALNPDYAEAHSDLGNTLKELGRLDEAEASYRQAIALNADFALAHSNLGKILYATGDKISALSSVKKANMIDPKSKDFSLLLSVLQARKVRKNNEVSAENINASDCILIPPSKILLLKIPVKQELTDYLYSTKLLNLDKERDPSFGATRGSKYDLFEDNHPVIQTLVLELNNILMKAFNLDIFIYDSFFSIFGSGGGTTRHNHVTKHDNDITFNLAKQKYALVYYLSVGDQKCDEPGVLKFYEPDEEILPSKGLITVFPADRYHSSVYGGNEDRVIVGVNFYVL